MTRSAGAVGARAGGERERQRRRRRADGASAQPRRGSRLGAPAPPSAAARGSAAAAPPPRARPRPRCRPRVLPPCSRMARERAGRAHPLVPQLDRQAGAARDACRRARAPRGARLLAAFAGERQADHDADRPMLADELEKARHGKALAGAADQGLERGGEELGLVAQGEADADRRPSPRRGGGRWSGRHGGWKGRGGEDGEDGGRRDVERRPFTVLSAISVLPSYCAIVAKNSLLFFVRFIRSSRNSSASTGGMSARKLRSR